MKWEADGFKQPSGTKGYATIYNINEAKGIELITTVYQHEGETPEECKKRAAFIVRACNSHDELLAALKMMNLAYVRLLETGRDRIIDYGGECDPVDVMESMSQELRQSKAAIAHAEAE